MDKKAKIKKKKEFTIERTKILSGIKDKYLKMSLIT